ncbi:Calx-beta domain-containing protein, partial [Microcoleus sp. D2_18a_B4]|uniref:Calx-beta domain-containing protein n=1 Tax=Microcoleus sp. D2_18a_B4 TaxID=3055329 RepID=UPI002FD1D9AC
MATSITGSLGTSTNYSNVNDLIAKWPTAAKDQGIQLSGIAFDGVETNYTNPTALSNLTLATNENPKSWLSYGGPAGVGVASDYPGWFTDANKLRAEINFDPNTNKSQVLKVKWGDNKDITSATIGLSGLLPKSSSTTANDQGNEAGLLQIFNNGALVPATNFTIARLNPPTPPITPKPIGVSSDGVTFIADRADGNFTFQIQANSTSVAFDELRFSAKAYDSPTAAYATSTSVKSDSSDYLVRSIQYQGIDVTPTPTPTSPSLFQFAQPNYTVAEGDPVTINITRTGGTAAASINYATVDDSASSAGTAADYTTAAGVLNFDAGQTTASFTVTALTDSILESPERVNLVLFGGNVSNTSILTINDVPPTPTPTPTPTSPSIFQFAQPNYTVAEGDPVTINVTRTGG